MSAAATASSPAPSALTKLGGYSPIPHTYFTVLPTKTGGFGTEHGLIGFIMSRTYGATRAKHAPAPEWTKPITLKEFAAVAQVTERAAGDAIDVALWQGLIRRKKVERGYIYQAAPENWADAPDRSAMPKKPMGKAESSGEETANHTGSALQVSLPPGQRKHPVFKLESETKVKCINESTVAHLSIENVASGVIRVRVWDSGERKANHTGSALQVSTGHVNRNNRPAVSVGQLHELLDDYFRRRHGKIPDDPLLIRITSALRPATFEHYKRLVHDRWKKGDVVGAGVLIAIAEEAGRAARVHKEKQSAKERRATEAFQLDIDSLVDALRAGDDPLAKEILETADPELVEQARRLV